MASVLFNAIGRGYQARTILGAIGRQSPKYSNFINNAYMAGYTGNAILSRIASKADGKNYDPDMFLTEHEKVQNRDIDQKRKAAMTLAAAGGTAALVAGGAYALMKRNQAVQPSAILPPLKQQKQIGEKKQPLAIGYTPKQAQPAQPSPSQPTQPIPMPQQQPQPQATSQAPAPQMAPDLTKTFELLKGLKEDRRLSNLIDGGFDLATTTALFRAAAPKNVLSILEKADGGLEKVVDDYKRFLDNAQAQQQQQVQESKAPENFAQMTSSMSQPRPQPQEQTDVMNEFMKAKATQNQPQQPQEIRSPEQQQQATSPIEQIAPQMIPPAPTKPLASLKNGQVGEIQSEKNGVATVNVNGQVKKEKVSELGREPVDTEEAVRSIINSIPEDMKSTAVQSMVHIPGLNIMLSQFYDGKWAYYLDMPEDVYQSVALGTYAPKGQATTGIGEYKPGVADSRGAGFHQEIKVNPKYNKENKGKTWGYATNEYSLLHNIQSILHKISKERYDEQGKLITPKTRTKK